MLKHISIILLSILVSSQILMSTDISQVDKNFAVEKVGKLSVVYKNALSAPFSVEGFAWRKEGEPLWRFPMYVDGKELNNGIWYLMKLTAGGVVRFRTDSPYITLRTRLTNTKHIMGHMSATGASGFDFFSDKDEYIKTLNPCHYKDKIPTPLEAPLMKDYTGGMRDYTLYLPLFNGVSSLEIGVAPNAKIEAPTPHKISKPVVFYGSSITHGACASRTANAYTAMLCRAVDAPMVNLGLSGRAKGEPRMAEIISTLDMSVFVYDYDHNAPNAEHLKATHEPFFKIIRAAHPNLPIIILSRVSMATDERAAIIRQTYENAKKNGDKNVWFIDGRDLFKEIPYANLTVDNVHPNDLGFYLMYKNTLPVLREALGIKQSWKEKGKAYIKSILSL